MPTSACELIFLQGKASVAAAIVTPVEVGADLAAHSIIVQALVHI